jgi:hypothetical protein
LFPNTKTHFPFGWAKEAAKKAMAALDPKLVDQLRAAFKHYDEY